MVSEPVRFPTADDPSFLLDGRLRLPEGEPLGVSVICHPHPAFGGHMDVWLLPTISERLARSGWAALRFNFRGADERSSVADLAGALAYTRGRLPRVPRLALVGWSYGALIGMLHGPDDPSVTDWVGIGAPTRVVAQAPMAPPPEGLAGWKARKTVIVGEHDMFFPPDTAGILAPDAVHVVAGADHFLFDRDHEVADLVVEVLADSARAHHAG